MQELCAASAHQYSNVRSPSKYDVTLAQLMFWTNLQTVSKSVLFWPENQADSISSSFLLLDVKKSTYKL